ncbi:MAG: hypothetical protein L0287_19820 [Anaerolineae bacterium]|nr:hypothetical protein [Anaerolineae bacterium]MCI0609620.1 hypothetical protein [Anaerolineae bacterium]
MSENIIHQGTVYEASYYAIPFLVELLKSSTTPDKADIATLLADMGNNSGGTRYAETIRLNVREELHLLYPYLFHEVYYVRAVIAHALQAFPEKAQEIMPLLEKALETEKDKNTKDTIEDSIKLLSDSK